MKKIKIIADEKIPFLKGIIEPYADIQYLPPLKITPDVVKNVDALIIRTRTKCDKELLQNSSIKFIATATIGFDHIDTAFCELKGIKWINAPGCNSGSVQQYIASSLLTLAEKKNIKLNVKTIGIVGIGNVGSKVEKLAKIFGMKVLLNDPPRARKEGNEKFVSLNYLIDNSDIITFHVPLNLSGIDKTYQLADEKFFQMIGKDKIIINTSRGEVVSTPALKNAMNSGKVIACTLDVWENEPAIDPELFSLVDIATPHIAGYSVEGKANGTSICVNRLNEFFNLGLEANWYPKYLPSPERSKEIRINCVSKSKQEIFFNCINSTYNIVDDDARLRKSIKKFERQRAEYPVRREFNYYDVHLNYADDSLSSAINELGFNLKIN